MAGSRVNYYERHLGDYARDTAHLSMLEHGAYSLLLDRYYATEQPIAADQAHRLARARTREEKAAVDAVLEEFFTLDDGMWRHGRVDAEIEKAQSRINAAKANGTKGGRPRKQNITQEKPTGFPMGSENETQSKALQTPDSIPHTPDSNGKPIGAASRPQQRGTRLPTDWSLPSDWAQWALAERPNYPVAKEAERFRDYWTGRAGADARKVCWQATWRNWVRNTRFTAGPLACSSTMEHNRAAAAEALRRAEEREARHATQ